MDHEFFTHQLESNQAGWDWLSLQLDDNTELMLFHIRRTDGTIDPFSAGTFVDAQGLSHYLRAADFQLSPAGVTAIRAAGITPLSGTGNRGNPGVRGCAGGVGGSFWKRGSWGVDTGRG